VLFGVCSALTSGAVRVLVAPDKFAGTLNAVEAAAAIAVGWARTAPRDALEEVPLSDGGPGFVDVVQSAVGGQLVAVTVRGPLGDPTPAGLLISRDSAYIESAQASGLHLVPPYRRDALSATTYGVGELLRAAVDLDVRRVVVGVGGTAATDGGAGVFDALGGMWPAGVELILATDVDNPLLGPYGAAATFAPQKGASSKDVETLEKRLEELVRVRGGNPEQPGAGAGGGLGYGLMLLGARRVSGIASVLSLVGLDRRVSQADLVITGEGAFDFSSLRGKVVSGVAAVAADHGRPCIVLAGRVDVGRREAAAIGVEASYSMVDEAGSVEGATSRPAEVLAALSQRVARHWSR
jgi:glycerate kinase